MASTKKTILAIALLLLAVSCDNNTEKSDSGVILCQYTDAEDFGEFEKLFSSVECIMLDTANAHNIFAQNDLLQTSDSYLIVDKSQGAIFRYDKDGNYLNSIGTIGRGDNEFLALSNIQIIGDTVQIYSNLNTAFFCYDLNGSFLCKKDNNVSALQIVQKGDQLFCYLGYDNGQHPQRVVVADSSGQVLRKHFPSTAKIISFSEQFDPMTTYKDTLFIRETYSNQISALCGDSSEMDYAEFDFGKYNIPKECFEASDPFQAAQLLLGSDFASLYRFSHNDKYSAVQVNYQFIDPQMKPCRMLGLSDGEKWHWISATPQGSNSIFYDGFKTIDQNNRVVVLADVGAVGRFAKQNPKLFERCNFEGLGENMILLLFELK